ncbi:MAG: ankyrin repeat domain-containing protein [Bryobacteraceae bacterium]
MSLTGDLLGSFEVHSPRDIRKALRAGASPVELIGGKRPVDCLIEMYFRSPQFVECLRVMLDAGAAIGDSLLEAVLLDDAAALGRVLQTPGNLTRNLNVLCAYTSLESASPLHVCAEFNSVRCAAVLLESGVDVDVRADIDGDGIGGQTPLFHAVNSNQNYCRPMMELLVKAGADLDIRLKGLRWGAGFEWETTVYDVTPISYTQCGLYSQFHRKERDVYSNLSYLYQKRYGSEPRIRNVPNKYLRSG